MTGVLSLIAANLMLAMAGWTAARQLLAGPERMPAAIAAAVLSWWWATVGVEALGSFGLLHTFSLMIWAVIGLALSLGVKSVGRAQFSPFAPWQTERYDLAAFIAFGMTIWVLLWYAVPSLVQPVKVVSDGPIYHLYMAARWWKAGRLFLVATPFGEVGATYFWANGEVWFTWLMTLGQGDRIARVGGVPFLILGTVATYATARRVVAGPSAAMIASCWFGTIGPLVLFGCEPNVDAQFIAGFLVAAYFFVRFALGDRGPGGLMIGSLAAGLTWGTKPTGLVFVPVLLGVVLIITVRAQGSTRERLIRTLILTGIPFLGMGFWAIRNLILTGNPLYPLHLVVGNHVLLRGWFGPSVMRHSPYYLPFGDWRSLVDQVVAVLDVRLVGVWLLAILGAWRIGRPRDRGHSQVTWGLAGLGVVMVGLYWVVIPYRSQQRFMLPGVGLAVTPLAFLFDRSVWVRWGAVALLALHVFAPQTWPFVAETASIPWDLSPVVPTSVPAMIPLLRATGGLNARPDQGVGVVALLLPAAWGLISFAAAWTWLRSAQVGTRRSLGVAVATSLVVSGSLVGLARVSSPNLPFPLFRDYLAGWLELENRVGPHGARIAYAGTNIPYYLLGGSLQNDVQYVNVDAHRDWLMHDYHRAAESRGLPPTWPNPYVGWDRVRPDYDAWLDNLRAARIDILVVARVNPREGPHNVADAEGFPIERGWAENHPRAFRPLYGVSPPDPRIRFYQVLPPGA